MAKINNSGSSRLRFVSKLPAHRILGDQIFLIYDRRLERAVPNFARWRDGFDAAYGVKAGEALKDLAVFSSHFEKILSRAQDLSPRRLTFVVAGGGSVGDFGGFVASVFKRGVNLIHVPTTWLAALDSAHGGKTALNSRSSKNQIGTFYPASDVFLVDEILTAQPEERAREALGELLKMALIDHGPWATRLSRGKPGKASETLLRYLRPAIEAKYRVVAKDPLEQNGQRQILNFGHTWGHVLEAAIPLPHGTAIAQGMLFALEWGRIRGETSLAEFDKALSLLNTFGLNSMVSKLSRNRPTLAEAKRFLVEDKKVSGRGEVTFLFLHRGGDIRRVNVLVKDLLREARRQGWIRP